jgi:septal ring factor EnvC (AmiA/AmiB activator)
MENTCPECGLTCGDVNCPYFRFNSLEEAGEYLSKLKVKYAELEKRSEELKQRTEELSKTLLDNPLKTLCELKKLESECAEFQNESDQLKKEIVITLIEVMALASEKMQEKLESVEKVGGDEK